MSRKPFTDDRVPYSAWVGKLDGCTSAMGKKTDVENLHKCAHEQCLCQVPSLQEYCSEYCSDADDVAEVALNCSCGHPACAMN